MRNTSLLCLAFLMIACTDSDEESKFTGTETAKKLCDDSYCESVIWQVEDFYLTPIDINLNVVDSDGNIASTNTLLVKFKDDVSISGIEIVLGIVDAKISAFIPDLNIYELKFDCNSIEEIEQKIDTLLANYNVELAEKNYAVQLESLDIEGKDDAGLWGFEKIKLAQAYDFIEQNGITLHPIKIADLDNGFDLNHQEFAGLDVEKYDFADTDNNVYYSDGHGTATAGIIFAQNNGTGINGIAYNADFLAYKIFPDTGENHSLIRTLVSAIVMATKRGASVINYSGNTLSANNFSLGMLNLAVVYANKHGVVIVCSAGNTFIDATNHYPSAYPEVISVGATYYDQYGLENRTTFSNFSQNDDPNILTLAAPGKDLRLLGLDNSYSIGEGTSFASPMVAGLAGLLKEIRPELNPDEVRRIMYESATEILVTYPDGVFHYWRRINVLEAVKKATHEMDLPNHGIGKPCSQNSDCDFDLPCLVGTCTEACFEEKDRGQDLGVTCDNCNLFSECPVGTTCKSFDQPYGRMPLRLCL
ncbi:MAG: S8 family serine peptidase [Patescibacteria group bacterium]|jgi:hypothetical protein